MDSQFHYKQGLVCSVLTLWFHTTTELVFAEYRSDILTALRSIPYPYNAALFLHYALGLEAAAIELELLGESMDGAGVVMIEYGMALLLQSLNGGGEK